MKRKLIIILSVILSLHLLYSNTMLMLHHFQIENNATAGTLDTIFRILFALSYSSVTAIIIGLFPKPVIFITISIIDGFGVGLKYFEIENNTVFTNLAAVYFGVYTMFLIVVTGLIQKSNNQPLQIEKNETENKKNEIETLTVNEIEERKYRLQKKLNPTKDENKRAEIESEMNQLEIEIKRRYSNE